MDYIIGDFSNITRITKKTLRYYDSIGLLKPASYDQDNGYRYYSDAQIKDAIMIKAYQNMGFSLKEISDLQQSRIPGMEIFENKLKETDRKIADLMHSRKHLIAILDSGHASSAELIPENKSEFKIERSRDTFVYYKKGIISSDSVEDFVREFSEDIERQDIEYTPPIMAYYYFDTINEQPSEFEIELFIEIKKTRKTPDNCRMQKGTLYASAFYVGNTSTSIENINSIDMELVKYIYDEGYAVAGMPVEVIWKQPDKQNDVEYILELRVPIKKD